jgi:hypothetical protein
VSANLPFAVPRVGPPSDFEHAVLDRQNSSLGDYRVPGAWLPGQPAAAATVCYSLRINPDAVACWWKRKDVSFRQVIMREAGQNKQRPTRWQFVRGACIDMAKLTLMAGTLPCLCEQALRNYSRPQERLQSLHLLHHTHLHNGDPGPHHMAITNGPGLT